MKNTLDQLKHLLVKTEQADRMKKPAAPAEISAWEKQHNMPIPEEIKAFLLFSDGLDYGMELIQVRPLNRIIHSEYSAIVPDGWLKLGSLLYGSADLVSDENGVLSVYDKMGADDNRLRKFSLKSWIEDQVFAYIENDSIRKTLDYVRILLEKAGMADTIHASASVQEMSEWEKQHNAVIPEEIKEFLQFSDGFQYRWGALDISSLDQIRFVKNWDNVPDGWLNLGSIIGDGAYLVSDENGILFLADHENHAEPLRRFSIKAWIEDHILEMIEEDGDVDRAVLLIESGVWRSLG